MKKSQSKLTLRSILLSTENPENTVVRSNMLANLAIDTQIQLRKQQINSIEGLGPIDIRHQEAQSAENLKNAIGNVELLKSNSAKYISEVSKYMTISESVSRKQKEMETNIAILNEEIELLKKIKEYYK